MSRLDYSTNNGAPQPEGNSKSQKSTRRFSLPDPPDEATDSDISDVKFADYKPLTGELPPAAPYPTESLGLLKKTVVKMAKVIQVPHAMPASSCLAAVCLAAQAHADIHIDGRVSPLSVYLGTIAPSGARKDEADKAALVPVYRFEEQLDNERKAALNAYQIDLEAYEAVKTYTLAKNKKEGTEFLKSALRSLGERPEPPLDSYLHISDLTIEGIKKFLQTSRPSIGIFTTEAGQLLGGHAFNSENILKTAAGISGLWDGKPDNRTRAGEGTSGFRNRRVCMHLMFQPVVAPLLFASDILIGQGLLGRLLFTMPPSLIGTRTQEEVDPALRETLVSSPDIEFYNHQLTNLLNAELPLKVGTRNELAPRKLSLSTAAYRAWLAFFNDTERRQKLGGNLHTITDLASKIANHACRLAGILALYEKVSCTEIDVDTMHCGIALATYHLNEAVRLRGQGRLSEELQQAQKLYHWLIEKKKTQITLVEIYKTGPTFIRTSSSFAKKIVQILIEHGLVANLDQKLNYDGVPRNDSYAVRFEV